MTQCTPPGGPFSGPFPYTARRSRLTAAAPPTEVVVYPKAGHAFMNEPRVEAYRPEAARDAWSRMLEFFRHHLVDTPGR